MTDTPYGVTGCRCRIADDYSDWITNPHCPYHGILPRDRTDTGVYRVIDKGLDGNWSPTPSRDLSIPPNATYLGAGPIPDPCEPGCTKHSHPVDPDSLNDRLRRGIEQAERGETIDRGDFTHDDIADGCGPGCNPPMCECGPVGHTDMAALNRQYREKYGAFSKKPAWWRRLFRR